MSVKGRSLLAFVDGSTGKLGFPWKAIVMNVLLTANKRSLRPSEVAEMVHVEGEDLRYISGAVSNNLRRLVDVEAVDQDKYGKYYATRKGRAMFEPVLDTIMK